MSSFFNKFSSFFSWFSQNFNFLPQKNARKLKIFLIIFAGLIAYHNLKMNYKRQKLKLPNGPNGIPILGTVILQAWDLKKFLLKTMPSYGPISCYYVGEQLMFIVNDTKLAYFLMNDDKLIHRPECVSSIQSFDKAGFTFVKADGEWSERRKLMVLAFSSMMTKDYIEETTYELLKKYTFEKINKIAIDRETYDQQIQNNQKNIKVWYFFEDFRFVLFNAIFQIMYGKFFEPDSEDYQYANDVVRNVGSGYGITMFMNMVFGRLSFIGPTIAKKALTNFRFHLEKLDNFCKKYYLESKEKYDENNLVTYCDHLIYELNKTKRDYLSDDIIYADLSTILSGALHSTSFMLQSCTLLLAKYPIIQQNVYDELHGIFGETKRFSFNKLDECPLLRAFVNEALRLLGPGSVNIPHSSIQDYDLELDENNILSNKKNKTFIGQKYVIPADSVILTNFAYLSNDKHNGDVWNNLQNKVMGDDNMILKCGDLNLGYWLKYDNNKKKYLFQNCKESIPFSVGKRSCPGRALAEKELFCIVANVMLNYEFHLLNPEAPLNFKLIKFEQFFDPPLGVIPIKR